MTLIRKPEKPKRSPMLNLKLSQKKYQSWRVVHRQRVLERRAEVEV